MTERWERVEALFHAALERGPADRAAFLRQSCGDDDGLLHEVESLLQFEGQADGFLSHAALDSAAKALGSDSPRPSPDTRIDGYRIVEEIGSGGMGDVFRARDEKLGREVALKVLPRSFEGDPWLRRFEEEARMASVLNHPNIVTIYGVGEDAYFGWIAMELVRGRNLRDLLSAGPMSVQQALDLAVQLADAMAIAHAAGIVHRDLKPANLMVTPEGLLKVLDFGIAKRQPAVGLPPEEHRDAAGPDRRAAGASPDITEDGTVLGTAGYMSPEQARGLPADPASDQFSFGAILYEMVSGNRAFQKSDRLATLSAILTESPVPIERDDTVSGKALQAIARCLSKDPAQRFADSHELAAEMRRLRSESLDASKSRTMTRRRALWLGGAVATAAAAGAALVTWRRPSARPAIASLAVLPFSNVRHDREADYLCDGIAESLIRGIARLPSISVRPRSAVFHFKGRDANPVAAGRLLHADAVLAGSVERRAGRFVVAAELLRVATGERLWSETYDRRAADALSVRDQIAVAVMDRLRFTAEERRLVERTPTRDPAAYELYLRGIHLFERENESDYLAARDLLRQAVARDGRFALAYAALATTYSVMAVDGYERPAEAWAQVTLNVRRALDWDRELPDAHSEAAAALFYFQWDWAGAEQEWDRALQSRGGGFVPDFLASRALQRWALGKTEEALRLIRQARQLDPLSASFMVREADYLLQLRELDGAVRLYESVIGTNPGDALALFGLAEARRAQGRFDEAIAIRRRAHEASGDASLRGVFATARGREGYARVEEETARLELESLRLRAEQGGYTSSLDVARAWARLGDVERALGRFETAFSERASGLVFLNADRAWDRIRAEPRFQAAVRRVGLA